jgi:membrane-associated protein
MVESPRVRKKIPPFGKMLLVAFSVVAIAWAAPWFIAFVSSIDLETLDHLYAVIFGFVVFDAIIPIFPSESLLTTGSNLAAQEGSDISLAGLIVAGTLGAIVGDSILYWLSRTVLRRSFEDRVEQAQRNEKIRRSMEVVDQTASLMIVFGRFVPGLRFVIGATMGITRYPYRKFLMWDAIGSTFWATYTCVVCYLVATVIDDKPVLSVLVSVGVTTALLGVMYRPLSKAWQDSAAT